MRQAVFVVPGQIAARTGGYVYDRRMVEGLRALGWTVDVREDALANPDRALDAVPDDVVVVVDGLALGMMPDVVERHAARLRLVALIHLPLAADVTRDRDEAARLEAGERRGLAAVRLVVVTGRATLKLLERYALASDRVVVVEPGTDRRPVARGSDGAIVRMLCVAAVHAGKGHEILIRALADIPHRHWRLICAGSLARDPKTVERVRGLIHDAGLGDRVELAGELDDAALARVYDAADLFVLATLQETFGMAVAEALAHGLPVVATDTGAIAALLADEAGLVVAPGDARALRDALAAVLSDTSLRARLASGARHARERLATWDEAAGVMSAALERAAHG